MKLYYMYKCTVPVDYNMKLKFLPFQWSPVSIRFPWRRFPQEMIQCTMRFPRR